MTGLGEKSLCFKELYRTGRGKTGEKEENFASAFGETLVLKAWKVVQMH